MAKDKITVTIDRAVLETLDADAEVAGLNRSQYVEQAVTHEHYRRLLARAQPVTASPPYAPDEDERNRALLDWQRTA